MSIVTWLLSRVSDVDGSVEINDLFDAFDFEMKESGCETPYSKSLFADHILKIFPNASKKRTKSKSTVTTYEGIHLRHLDKTEPSHVIPSAFHPQELKENLPETVKNIEMQDNSVRFSVGTDHYCDGNEVLKQVTLFNNGRWSLHISTADIDLESLYVSDTYLPTKESIATVVRAVKLIQLCDGVTVTQSIIMTRYHVLNKWQYKETVCRKLHSILCNKVVPMQKLSTICRKCSKMTFKTSCENEKENPSRNTSAPVENDSTNKPCASRPVTREAIQALIPDANGELIEMMLSQAENATKHPNGRRWSKNIIGFCLQWYCKNPQSYESVRESKYLALPSRSLLIQYKTRVKQGVGFDDNMFKWMHEEAVRKGICEEGYFGGLVIDEMSIQADIEITKSGDIIELVGLTDVGEEGNLAFKLRKGKNERTIGTHALQLVFLGVTGFRFPIAHFISDGVQAAELYPLFWEAVDNLKMFGFTTVYTCLDGAQSNRSFMKINLGQNPVSYRCRSPCCYNDMVFMMDFSHVVKKIRNNVIKSGVHAKSTRNLLLSSGNSVQWQMFVDCYKWDKANALQLHRKLTNEHMFPSNQSKMRNHLAEDVLDAEMLNLFVQYQKYLGEKGLVLDGVIELLKQTSRLIRIFRDMRPVKTVDDLRLSELSNIGKWFDEWEKGAMNNKTIQAKDRAKRILSHQAHEDVQSCIVGFIELCHLLLSMSRKVHITPGLTNSDVVENTFNQQRSTYNGANTNPSALQYRRSINSILLGQNTISQKGNAGKNREAALPYNCSVKSECRKRPAKDTKRSHSSTKVIRM